MLTKRKNMKEWEKVLLILCTVFKNIVGAFAFSFIAGGWMLCAIIFNW